MNQFLADKPPQLRVVLLAGRLKNLKYLAYLDRTDLRSVFLLQAAQQNRAAGITRVGAFHIVLSTHL